ncbi:MAG: phosphoglucosamine mutase [Thermoplasmata archaeon]|nr:phosphoglucosamine mutase [Thermoplasmata archaeon]
MFGSSGVRGIVGKEMNPRLALKIGEACGQIYGNVVIGNDPRTSSIMIKNAVISGLLACGAEVTDVGMVATPTLAYAARNYDIGIIITASHNPAEYNGIKIFNRDGSGISLKDAKKIEELVKKEPKYVEWNEIRSVEKKDVIKEHLEAILNDVESNGIEIAVDCTNGATSTITPYLLRGMGCKVIAINSNPDGFFPAHPPEPVDENLQQIKEICKARNIVGVAHDCDGDRMVAILKGKLIENEKLMVLFAKYVDAKKIVVPVDASMLLDDLLDAEIYRTRVGDIFISEKLKEINGDFGAEPSGTWIFPSFSYCPDGIYAVAKFVEMLREIDVGKEIEEMPEYNMKRISFKASKEKIEEAMERIREEIKSMEYENLIEIDGYRIEFEDSWALIRKSGTEPKIRLTVEAKDKEKMNEILRKMEDLVRRCLE